MKLSLSMERWQYPVIGAAVALNALLALRSDHPVSTWNIVLGTLWVVVAACLGLGLAIREERLATLCERDPATGLFNRRHFELCFKRALASTARRGEPLALLVIDVDGLKTINDTLGHAAGDQAIAIVAEALKEGCRTEDIAARWGGDEFVIVAPHTNEEQAEILSRRISVAVRAAGKKYSMEHTRNPLWVTVSVGCAIAQPHEAQTMSAAALFESADEAMYQRKAKRRAVTRRLEDGPRLEAVPAKRHA